MSDTAFAIAVTMGTFAFLVMWVPFLDSCAAVLQGMSAKVERVEELGVGEFEGDAVAVE